MPYIHRVCICRTCCHIFNFLVTGTDSVFRELRQYAAGCRSYRDAVTINGCIANCYGRARAVHGDVVTDLHSLIHLDAVYIFHFLRQFDLQGITSRFYTDVATGESAGCFALYTQGVAQLDLAAGPTVARKGQAVVFRFVKRCFGRLTQVNYIVRDIGCSIFRPCHSNCFRAFAYLCTVSVYRINRVAVCRRRGVSCHRNVCTGIHFRRRCRYILGRGNPVDRNLVHTARVHLVLHI